MTIIFKSLYVVLMLGILGPVLAQDNAPLVTTAQGKLIGEYSSRNNRV